ncbi:MAG: LysR family transcriptional regulator [Clostridioides sp.]|jgi:DNA-binding transcriptional LysR family regulator|nr:LysR family transcriptional regulator [Clostridioides sp.]
MDIKQLEVFVTVVKFKSFSKASKELFLTQPTVSTHIQNLEKELGTVLLNRSNRIITPTKSGNILYDHAIFILNNFKKAIYDIKEYSGKIEGIIDIASSTIPETYLIPNFLKFFTNKYPDVQFSISHYASQDAITEVLDERVSFGFVGSKQKNSQIKYVNLINDELVLIASKELKIENQGGYIDISELKKFPFILRKDASGTKDVMMKTLGKHRIYTDDLNVIAYVESNEAIKEMVRLNLGISFVSLFSVKDYLKSDKLKIYRIKNVDLFREFYFIYSSKKAFTPLENKFLDLICEYFEINLN